jgi:hypothetical protein
VHQTVPRFAERRSAPRRATEIPAVIVFEAARTRLPCMVRNLSAGGAKLEIFTQSQLPVTFDLLIEGELVPCQLVWRNLWECGVEFVGR